MALGHTARVVVDKAAIAMEIANVIEILWIPFIWERYEELKKEAKRLPEILTSLEYRQTRMLSLEEENRAKDKIFKMIFQATAKISRKHCMTLAVAPRCRTSRHKPRRLLHGRIEHTTI